VAASALVELTVSLTPAEFAQCQRSLLGKVWSRLPREDGVCRSSQSGVHPTASRFPLLLMTRRRSSAVLAGPEGSQHHCPDTSPDVAGALADPVCQMRAELRSDRADAVPGISMTPSFRTRARRRSPNPHMAQSRRCDSLPRLGTGRSGLSGDEGSGRHSRRSRRASPVGERG